MTERNFESFAEIDCDWLALRFYIGDEMPAAERAEFEALLADDQAAREALAAAVELFAAVPLALSAAGPQDVGAAKLPAKPLVELTAKLPIGSAPEPVVLAEAARRNVAQRRIWTQRWAWASLGAAACLVAILGITAHRNGALSPDRTNGHEILPSAVASDAVEAIWDWNGRDLFRAGRFAGNRRLGAVRRCCRARLRRVAIRLL